MKGEKIKVNSEITCPKCEYKKTEVLPTDVCLLSYTCEKCKTVLHPKSGDCCVFCTYGDVKCPSMQ
ncbi:MAG: GDCCVxC domain-containing (seleno)protein [Bacteroidota bacterium]|nr:GDCCVxC domain-containing (seleno)protein [Bacteroidota bacterium]